MSIETTFNHLATQCRKQRDMLSELQITVAEDRPLHGIVKLVDKLGESVEDALGDAEESLSAAVEAQQVVSQTKNWNFDRRVLTTLCACQTSVNQLQQRFFSEMACYSTIDDVVGLGRKRGGEWKAWADLVGQSLDRCQRQLFDTQQALFQCWQEVAERMIPNAESPPAVNEPKKLALIKDHRPEKRNAS
jgi:excinuclease UvrABC ATPase subunit